jgi:CDP-paratose 2-epimerase
VARSLSVWTETQPLLEELAGRTITVSHGDWRPGDQKVYLSDISKAKADFGWEPKVSPEEGLRRLWRWIQTNRGLFT